jgi:hypothetical protein
MASGEHAWLRESTHSFGRTQVHKILGKSERVRGLPMTSHRLPCRPLRRRFSGKSGISGLWDAACRLKRTSPFAPPPLRPAAPRERRRTLAARRKGGPAPPPQKCSPLRPVGGAARWSLAQDRLAGWEDGRKSDTERRVAFKGGPKRALRNLGVCREFMCRRTSFRFHLPCTAFHFNDVGCDCTCQKEFAM